MAVNVDTVYKTVLLILNKEQRGYMTPDEFNKMGIQVQREIFERYFEDLNQQVRIPQTDMDYADRVEITDEKIAEFKTQAAANGSNPFTLPTDLYRLGSTTYEPTGYLPREMQRVGRNEYYNIKRSPLTAPTTNHPIYLYENNELLVYPTDITSKVLCQYVKKPTDPRWGYSLGSVGQFLYDSNPYIDTAGAIVVGTGFLTSSITDASSSIAVDDTYPGLTTTVSPAGGTGAILEAVVSGGVVTSLSVTNAGSGYSVGDILTVSQIQLPGAATPLTATLVANNIYATSTYGSTNFELHNSEQTELILNILFYAGVVIRDPQVVQVAVQETQRDEANEKS